MIPLKNIIYNNFYLLQEDLLLGSLFPNPPLLAYRRDKNIQDLLVRSTVHSNMIAGTFTCGRPRCITCKHVSQNTLIKGPKSNFTIKNHFTCTTAGVVYCIHCGICNELYIGETGRLFAERFRQHVYNARKQIYKTGEVSKHFNKPGHSYTDMNAVILLQLSQQDRRKKMEEHLIYKLGTLDPCGMNELCNFQY
jgi:Na+-translocating ferredoxin:NAD+ oxidoreductase RnfC subunit